MQKVPVSPKASLVEAKVKQATVQMMQEVSCPKAFAEKRGVTYQTLVGKYNINSEKNLRVEEWVQDLLNGEALGPLQCLAHELGCVAVPALPPPSDEKDLHRLLIQGAIELGDVSRAMLQATDPAGDGGTAITKGELAVLEKELAEALGVFALLREHLRAGFEKENENKELIP